MQEIVPLLVIVAVTAALLAAAALLDRLRGRRLKIHQPQDER